MHVERASLRFAKMPSAHLQSPLEYTNALIKLFRLSLSFYSINYQYRKCIYIYTCIHKLRCLAVRANPTMISDGYSRPRDMPLSKSRGHETIQISEQYCSEGFEGGSQQGSYITPREVSLLNDTIIHLHGKQMTFSTPNRSDKETWDNHEHNTCGENMRRSTRNCIYTFLIDFDTSSI